MHKFLISYLLMETEPRDLHNAFKDKLKSLEFSEFIIAHDNGGGEFFSKLPHTTLWCVATNITSVTSAINQAAMDVIRKAMFNHDISPRCADKIKLKGGLIESLSVSFLLPAPGQTALMSVQKGSKNGIVLDSLDIEKCLAHQKANS